MKPSNEGPIGPLDPNEPPPNDPELKPHHELDAHEVVKALRSMGVDITEEDLEYWALEGGPPHRMLPGKRMYTWGDVLNWTSHTSPVPMLNRKEATEYIQGLDYPIEDWTLNELVKRQAGPVQKRIGRRAFYTKENLEKWVAEQRAKPKPVKPYGPKPTKALRLAAEAADKAAQEAKIRDWQKELYERSAAKAKS